MKIVKQTADLVEKLCVALCILLTALITFAAFMQVFSRFALGGAWKWTDEASRYCLVWLTMLGAALGVRRHAHLAIDLVLKALPQRLQMWIEHLILLCSALFGAVLVYTGYQLSSTVMGQKSAVLGLPMGMVYLAVPVFGLFLALFSLEEFCERLASPKKGA